MIPTLAAAPHSADVCDVIDVEPEQVSHQVYEAWGKPICDGTLDVSVLLDTGDVYEINADLQALMDDPLCPTAYDATLRRVQHYLPPDGNEVRCLERSDLQEESLERLDAWLWDVACEAMC